MDKLTRKDKIKLLQAIANGKIDQRSITRPQVYFFIERSNQPGQYHGPGDSIYSQQEYEQFCADIKAIEPQSIVWHEGKTYENTILTFRPAKSRLNS